MGACKISAFLFAFSSRFTTNFELILSCEVVQQHALRCDGQCYMGFSFQR